MKQEVSFMGCNNNRYTMKWWDPQTKKPKYCLCETFDEQNNKFGKVWPPSYELMTGTSFSILPRLKIILLGHTLNKYDIFEVTVTFPPRGNPIVIVDQYCDHHNMSYF